MAVTDTDYNSTWAVTDVVNEGVNYTIAANENLAVDNTGMSQSALYSLMNEIVTNVNGMNAKLDADGGVSDANYASLYNLTAMASQGYGLGTKGMWQADLIAELTEFETNFNAILTKLDNDGGTTDSDYNSTYAVDLNNTVVGSYGIDQGKLVTFLQSMITNINATLTKLDSD